MHHKKCQSEKSRNEKSINFVRIWLNHCHQRHTLIYDKYFVLLVFSSKVHRIIARGSFLHMCEEQAQRDILNGAMFTFVFVIG